MCEIVIYYYFAGFVSNAV